jgi:uncharacterized protein (DUF111 family)
VPGGLSKEMMLAAVFDAGGDQDAARVALQSIGGSGSRLSLHEVQVVSVRCRQALLEVSTGGPPIIDLESAHTAIDRIDMSDAARLLCKQTYRALFEAESMVHGVTLEEVRLHESGTTANMAVVASFAVGLTSLDLDRVTIGTIAVGFGSIRTESHGTLPVPPPAVSHLLSGYAVESGLIQGELVSPTSAALIRASTVRTQELPQMEILGVGRGAGRIGTPAEAFATLLIGTSVHDTDARPVDGGAG